MKNVASYIVCIFYIICAIPIIDTNYLKYSKMVKELFNCLPYKHKWIGIDSTNLPYRNISNKWQSLIAQFQIYMYLYITGLYYAKKQSLLFMKYALLYSYNRVLGKLKEK